MDARPSTEWSVLSMSSSWPVLSAAVLAMLVDPAVVKAGDAPAAAGRLDLEVRVVGIDGKPVEQGTVSLWRLATEAERAAEQAGGRSRSLWREADTGRVWVSAGGFVSGSRLRFDNLSPGTYRVAGFLGQDGPTPLGVSDSVVLDAGRKDPVVTVRLKPGPTVSFRLVDAASHRPVPGARVELVREDSTMPPSWNWPLRGVDERGQATIPHVPPGAFVLAASRPASRPEDLEYAAAEKGKVLVVAEGVDQVVTIPMAGRPLTPAEIEARWGWVATGRVVDEFGRPVADAEVRVATGRLTLRGGSTTRTGPDGRFTLRFAEGIWSNDPANAQAAVFSVTKEKFLEKSRSRPGHHMMARQMPDARARRGVEPDRIILKGRPYAIDFVLAEPAVVEVEADGLAQSGSAAAAPADFVQVQPTAASGRALARPGPSLDVVDPNEPDQRGSARSDGPNRWSLLPGRPWRFEVTDPGARTTVRSFPFTLPRAGRYRMALRYTPDQRGGVDLLEILSVTGPVGNREIRDKVVGDDPMARPPVPEDLQHRGREVLRRMAEANWPWLGPVTEGVESYEYRFRFGDDEGQTFRVGGGTGDGDVRRGISHGSPVRHLALHPEAATFRQVEFGTDRITLAYTLKEPIGVWAGNGVEGTWRGFFSMGLRQGVLVLDAHRITPLEGRSEWLRETFSRYVEVGPGRFAPMAIRVEKLKNPEMDFQWTFQVVEPGLWLFAASEDESGRIIARVDRVRVNGAEAKPIAREGRADEPD
jgi:hypothetical protein